MGRKLFTFSLHSRVFLLFFGQSVHQLYYPVALTTPNDVK